MSIVFVLVPILFPFSVYKPLYYVSQFSWSLHRSHSNLVWINDNTQSDLSTSFISSVAVKINLCDLITGRNEVVAKVIFLHLCVILFTGGRVWGRPPGSTPPGQTYALGQTHPPGQTPPRSDTPWVRHPPGLSTPPGTKYTPLGLKYTPQEADSGMRSTSGRYVSYWNAFLFHYVFKRKRFNCIFVCRIK